MAQHHFLFVRGDNYIYIGAHPTKFDVLHNYTSNRTLFIVNEKDELYDEEQKRSLTDKDKLYRF